jgi:protein kinase A
MSDYLNQTPSPHMPNVVQMTKKTLVNKSNKRKRVKSCNPILQQIPQSFRGTKISTDYRLNKAVSLKCNSSDRNLNTGKMMVYFEFHTSQKVRILISEPELTVGWLYCECMRRIAQFEQRCPNKPLNFKIENFLMLKTKSLQFNIDYYLTNLELPVSKLPYGIILVPFITKEVPESQKNTIHNYKILAKLGEGGFSTVFLVRKKDDGMVHAMKVVDRNQQKNKSKLQKYIYREREIWSQTKFEFCCGLNYVFYNNSKIFFVGEFCPGGELFYHIRNKKKFKEEAV